MAKLLEKTHRLVSQEGMILASNIGKCWFFASYKILLRILAFITGLLSSHKCLFKNKIWCYANRFPNTKSSLIWWRQPLSWSCMEGWFFTPPYVNPIDPILLRFRMHEFADVYFIFHRSYHSRFVVLLN